MIGEGGAYLLQQPVSGINEFLGRDPDVAGDLPEQDRRNVASLMEWHGRASAVQVAKL